MFAASCAQCHTAELDSRAPRHQPRPQPRQRIAEYPDMRDWLRDMRRWCRTRNDWGRLYRRALEIYDWIKCKESLKAPLLTKQRVRIYEAAGRMSTRWLGNDADWPEFDPDTVVATEFKDDVRDDADEWARAGVLELGFG